MGLDAYRRLLAQQEEDAKKASRGKKQKHEESFLQRECVSWFRWQFPEHAKMLFAVPNGGGRSRIEASIMKAEGVTAGVSDLILLEARGEYGALCIEMKTTSKNSRQRESQKVWQEAAEKAGNKYVVIRTLDEFKDTIVKYMALPGKCVVVVKGEDLFKTMVGKNWRDALKDHPEPGTTCRVMLMYDTYEATWDGHDWIDRTGYRLLGVVSWMPKDDK